MKRRAAVFTSAVAIVILAMTVAPHVIDTSFFGGARNASGRPAAARTCQGGYSYGYDGTSHGTFIRLETSPPVIVVGQRTKVHGTLFNHCPGGTPVPLKGKTVRLQRRLVVNNAERDWKTFATLVTSDDGTFFTFERPSFNTRYRALFAGSQTSRVSSAPYEGSHSNWEAVYVRVGVSIQPLSASAPKGQNITFTGHVTPSKPGKKVAFQVYDKTKHKWRFLARDIPLDANSQYSFTFAASFVGKLWIRAVYATQDRLNLANVSRTAVGNWT